VNKELKILIPLEGLIDPQNEILRLEKNISKLSKEKIMILGKLQNVKFLDNAPKELVEGQKEREAIISSEILNLENELTEIKKLT
jgi:valyl-tRNA synthetase